MKSELVQIMKSELVQIMKSELQRGIFRNFIGHVRRQQGGKSNTHQFFPWIFWPNLYM